MDWIPEMEEFLGKEYQLTSSENFDEYLRYLGKNYFLRKAALSLKPVLCLTSNEDGSYTFSMTSILASISHDFRLGEEFEETRPPNDKVQSVVTMDGNKMTHVQTEKNGAVSRHVRTFYADRMVSETTVDGWDVICIRNHELVRRIL